MRIRTYSALSANLAKNEEETNRLTSGCDVNGVTVHTCKDSPCQCDLSGHVGSEIIAIAQRKAELRKKIIKTVILYSGVFILGLQWGVIGPSLPDLELLTGGSTSYIALILTGRNIAALIGSALAGFLIDRYNNWLLLAVAEVFLGVLFAVAPWNHGLVLLAVCLIPSGIAAGFYDTGVNVAVLRVWDGKPGPWIQAMECIDAVGSFVAPLITHPFLAYKTSNPWEEEVDFYLNQSSIHVKQPVASYGQSHNLNISAKFAMENQTLVESEVYNVNQTSVTLPGAPGEIETSRVMFAYLIVGVLLVLAAGAHFAVFCRGKRNLRITKSESEECILQSTIRTKKEQRIRLFVLPLLFLICFAYYALETGYAHYLMTFCVKYLKWDKASGVAVTSAFWGAYTTGTAVGIVLIRFVKPRTLLLVDVSLCLTSQIMMACFLTSSKVTVWACTIAAGLSIATIFASVFSWAQKNIGINGKVNALMMSGMSVGEMTSPAIIGILIDKSGAISWVYCMLAAAILCTIVLIFMQILATRLKKVQRSSLIEEANTKTNLGNTNAKIRISDEIKKELA